MSNVFFTADTHFGHGNIIKYCHRPYLSAFDQQVLEQEGRWHNGDWKGPGSSQHRISHESVEMMNNALIDNINSVVREDDTLWHLGDWCFAPKQDYYNKAKFYRDRIACKDIRIVWGNHDHRSIANLFTENHELCQVYVGNQPIVLCHYAMAVWDKSHRGSWQLYGHSHSGAEPWMDKNMSGRRSLDVGVDNADKLLGDYGPFAFKEIQAIMAKRSGFSMDQHIPRNNQSPSEESIS